MRSETASAYSSTGSMRTLRCCSLRTSTFARRRNTRGIRLRQVATVPRVALDGFVADGLIRSNPVAERLGAERWGYRGEARSLSADEVNRLLTSPGDREIRDLRNHCRTCVAVLWGGRPRDLVLLQWGQLLKLPFRPVLRRAFLRYHAALDEPGPKLYVFPSIRRARRRQPVDARKPMSPEGARTALARWGQATTSRTSPPTSLSRSRSLLRAQPAGRERPPAMDDDRGEGLVGAGRIQFVSSKLSVDFNWRQERLGSLGKCDSRCEL